MTLIRNLSKICALALVYAPGSALAQSASDAAAALANPLASMISVPLTFDYTQNIGASESGSSLSLTIKPVIPVALGGGWNMISRTVISFSRSDSGVPGEAKIGGISNINESLFFSPTPTKLKKDGQPNGWEFIWGIGPIIGIPTNKSAYKKGTGSHNGSPVQGSKDWTLGPTGVFLLAGHGYSIGTLLAQSWSVGGTEDVNSLFFQPFFSYTNKESWTFGINTESTYDFNTDTYIAPINLTIQKLVKSNDRLIAYQGGLKYYAKDSPESPKGWGARFQVTFLFPKK